MSGLLTAASIAEDPADYVARHGVVLATFDDRTQDSGNVSWVVDADSRRLFVKTPGRDAPPPGARVLYFDRPGRVALLRNAVGLARSVSHPTLPPRLIVDSATGGLTVVDLDAYRRGPSTNDMGRMFGATRFMAPEGFERGAQIDQRTTVFTLGRLVWHFGTRLTERRDHFCGPPALATVVRAACDFDRAMRPPTVAAFADAWWRERAGMDP